MAHPSTDTPAFRFESGSARPPTDRTRGCGAVVVCPMAGEAKHLKAFWRGEVAARPGRHWGRERMVRAALVTDISPRTGIAEFGALDLG